MKSLTPEQQAFAEEHHGLLLDFMAKHSLGDDYYDLLANRYLKVVVRYLSEEALRKYSFSTVAWYHLIRSLVSRLKGTYVFFAKCGFETWLYNLFGTATGLFHITI